jgi:hypothetical protein
MSFRDSTEDLANRVRELEHRIRHMEQPGCCPPDRGWILTQVGTDLQYLYVPTGTLGPVIGSQ